MSYRSTVRAAVLASVALCLVLTAAGAAVAAPAGGSTNVDSALQPFVDFLGGLVRWLLGPGRLIIALAWLVVGFKVVLGMERAGAGGFVFVALVGLAIVYAPNILGMLGIDIGQWVNQ
ncbi:MAG: hypothetical protein QN202_09670 [Armatimonadota bacterium]|nr:hypothetical protein [Armatimonadota bacterium]